MVKQVDSNEHILRTFHFASTRQGPEVLVLGAVHGDETCGFYAISRLLQELSAGEITLARGSLTLVPQTNEQALCKRCRYVEQDLNRVVRLVEAATSYEEQIAQRVIPLIESSAYLLDLHSFDCNADAFAFVEDLSEESISLARATGVNHIVYGSGQGVESARKKQPECTMTAYAAKQGKTALTVECGGHSGDSTYFTAYAALRGALHFLGFLPPFMATPANGRILEVVQTHLGGSSFRFAKHFTHMDIIKKGQLIGYQRENKPIRALSNGFIFLPNDTMGHKELPPFQIVQKSADR